MTTGCQKMLLSQNSLLINFFLTYNWTKNVGYKITLFLLMKGIRFLPSLPTTKVKSEMTTRFSKNLEDQRNLDQFIYKKIGKQYCMTLLSGWNHVSSILVSNSSLSLVISWNWNLMADVVTIQLSDHWSGVLAPFPV